MVAMTGGTEALKDAHAKLDWATNRHDEMQRLFEEFARPGGGPERPYGIKFDSRARPAGLVVARFIVEKPLPPEMGLLAADLVHNARTALDHVVARLKDHFGGDAGQGGFPVCREEADWRGRVEGGSNPLDGLGRQAVNLIYGEQPLHRDDPAADSLVVLNKLDNADKHRLLHPAFVYPHAQEGLDLIEVTDAKRVTHSRNAWESGKPLGNGTTLASYIVKGTAQGAIRAREEATLGYATGVVGSPRVGYTEMIERVSGIADKAAQLIDTSG